MEDLQGFSLVLPSPGGPSATDPSLLSFAPGAETDEALIAAARLEEAGARHRATRGLPPSSRTEKALAANRALRSSELPPLMAECKAWSRMLTLLQSSENRRLEGKHERDGRRRGDAEHLAFATAESRLYEEREGLRALLADYRKMLKAMLAYGGSYDGANTLVIKVQPESIVPRVALIKHDPEPGTAEEVCECGQLVLPGELASHRESGARHQRWKELDRRGGRRARELAKRTAEARTELIRQRTPGPTAVALRELGVHELTDAAVWLSSRRAAGMERRAREHLEPTVALRAAHGGGPQAVGADLERVQAFAEQQKSMGASGFLSMGGSLLGETAGSLPGVLDAGEDGAPLSVELPPTSELTISGDGDAACQTQVQSSFVTAACECGVPVDWVLAVAAVTDAELPGADAIIEKYGIAPAVISLIRLRDCSPEQELHKGCFISLAQRFDGWQVFPSRFRCLHQIPLTCTVASAHDAEQFLMRAVEKQEAHLSRDAIIRAAEATASLLADRVGVDFISDDPVERLKRMLDCMEASAGEK